MLENMVSYEILTLILKIRLKSAFQIVKLIISSLTHISMNKHDDLKTTRTSKIKKSQLNNSGVRITKWMVRLFQVSYDISLELSV